jgi:hypothetical protein
MLEKADFHYQASSFQTNHNNNNNKRPFSHSFENRYLTKVPGVSLLTYGTLFNQRKAPLT